MKKEVTFIVSWIAFSFAILYLLHRFNTLIDVYFEDSFYMPAIYLKKEVVPLLGILVLGLNLGIFVLNAKYFTRFGYVISITFALYLTMKLPLMMISNSLRFIYPTWMYSTSYEITSYYGTLIIAFLILNLFKGKVIFLRSNGEK